MLCVFQYQAKLLYYEIFKKNSQMNFIIFIFIFFLIEFDFFYLFIFNKIFNNRSILFNC